MYSKWIKDFTFIANKIYKWRILHEIVNKSDIKCAAYTIFLYPHFVEKFV